METQFSYIQKLASEYHLLNKDDKALFNALNQLSSEILRSITTEYADPERILQPVNLLRAEIARLLLTGSKIDANSIEIIKENIRSKNSKAFSHLSTKQLNELSEYEIGKKDMFTAWQKHWNVLHVFFYRDLVKQTVNLYLTQIAENLLIELQLRDYSFHTVDFYGAANFGSDLCWIALFPQNRESHKDAFQFFLRISHSSEAGRMAGSDLKEDVPDIVKKTDSYSKVLVVLKDLKSNIIELNNKLRNFFKFAPGKQASQWEIFYKENVIAISFFRNGVTDMSNIQSREELLRLAGYGKDDESNQIWNMWLFKSAHIGDVVFATKGVNKCIGIGIITGPYYYEEEPEGYNHRRKVEWITDKVYEYSPNNYKKYKSLFRFDTFSPTKVSLFILGEYVRMYPELAEIFQKNNLKYELNEGLRNIRVNEKEEVYGKIDDSENNVDANYWWLNANPTIWSIAKTEIGEKQFYTTHNEKGNKRRIYKYFETVQPDDLVIGYESSPVKQIRAIFKILTGIHQHPKHGEIIEFEIIEKPEVPVHWNELQKDVGLQNCEVFKNNQGSIFKLTSDEYDIVREIIDNKNIRTEPITENPIYDYKSDVDRPFIPFDKFKTIIEILNRKKNIILQGPAGVGKTYVAKKIAYEMIGRKTDHQIEMVQFHQSYSYEDFIQGLRPSKNGFELRNGLFYDFCLQVSANPDKKYFFIIDEINRGNLSKIFGELMMLIESDKRTVKNAIRLTYSSSDDNPFFIPENLYIIGTMNTADRSLALVDYALRRRFAFVELQPNFDELFVEFMSEKGISKSLTQHIQSSLRKINKTIVEDPNLGKGFQMGHSYFCNYSKDTDENKWFENIVKFELKPMLEELWFDEPKKVQEMENMLTQ